MYDTSKYRCLGTSGSLTGGMAPCQAAARPDNRAHTISGSSAPVMRLPLHGVLHKFPRSYAAGILFSRRVSNIIKKDISFLLPVGSNFESKEQSI